MCIGSQNEKPYSVFTPQFKSENDPLFGALGAAIRPREFLRVFLTGENIEPHMDYCEFAMTSSVRTDHINHLRIPLWVYENRGWGYGPTRLVKNSNTDWEKIADGKTGFCNFIYSREVKYRNSIYRLLSQYKRMDSAGRCRNNMNGLSGMWLRSCRS